MGRKVIQIHSENERQLEYLAFKWINAPDSHDMTIAKKKLRKALIEELTETQRKYVFEYYVAEKTMEQIAYEYGVNKSTVSRGITRARRRLHKVLKYTSPAFL